MAKQRISYVPLDKMDARMRAEMERCQREGTPRPESSAIRAHVPACFWFFAESWHNIFRTGILDHDLVDADGTSWTVPGRLIACTGGAIVIMTFLKPAAMAESDFASDMARIDDEFSTLRANVEAG